MRKLVSIVKRMPQLGVEDFQRLWREAYGRTVASDQGVLRCVQNHPLPQGYRKKELPFDGVAELWFADDRACRAWLSEGSAALAKASADVADPARTVHLPVTVHVVKDGAAPAGALKNIELVRRRKGMTFDAFHHYWFDVHGPIAAGIPQVLRYEQNRTDLGAYRSGEPVADGLAVTWFNSTAEMRAAAETSAFAEAAADEPNFLSGEPVPFVIATETVIKP